MKNGHSKKLLLSSTEKLQITNTRNLENNKKHDCILESAKSIFFQHGIKRVTIEEICKKANVSKMTFYKFFKNKNELAKEVLQSVFNSNISDYNNLMAENTNFEEKLLKLIKLKIEKSESIGELFLEEIFETNIELIEFINQKKDESIQMNIEFIKKGQKEDVFRESITPEMFNYLVDNLIEMIHSERLKKIIPEIHKRIEELTKYFFYGITIFDKKA